MRSLDVILVESRAKRDAGGVIGAIFTADAKKSLGGVLGGWVEMLLTIGFSLEQESLTVRSYMFTGKATPM